MSRVRLISLMIAAAVLAGCATTSGGLPSPDPSTSSPSGGGSTGSSGSAGTSGGGDMSTGSAAGGSGSGDGIGEASTAEERRGTLDRRLDDSLGEFDKTLGEEQRRSAAERDARAAATAGSRPSGDADGDGGRREGDLRSERGGKGGAEGRGEREGKKGGGDRRDRGTVPGGGSGAPDRGIPSGDDDDIVARRLRRAAEQETDPELKEKLWKEYIEYKKNSKGGG